VVRLEFTVEPFHEGDPGPHVLAALEAARQAGLEVEFGPFGTAASGPTEVVAAALGPITRAAYEHGATRITLQVEPV
jgi:uncharacterized protein YqgV (UPF0045/DUF77 family)